MIFTVIAKQGDSVWQCEEKNLQDAIWQRFQAIQAGYISVRVLCGSLNRRKKDANR